MTTCPKHPGATLLPADENGAQKWYCPECGDVVLLEISDKVLRAKYRRNRQRKFDSSPGPTETQFEDAVIALAHLHGWLVEHKRPARLEDGSWRTAIQGDKGGPDLLMARNGVVIVAELKAEKGKLSPEQEAWHVAANTLIWRPSNWEEIATILA